MLSRIFYIFLLSLTFLSCGYYDYNDYSVNNHSEKILVDASHDGGVWWYPQSAVFGFSPSIHHQGKNLADLLREKGFLVDELPSYTLVTDSILQLYSKVIRAGSYGSYQESELRAYANFLTRSSSLFLISEFQQPGQTDQLAERLGIDFRGTHSGHVNRYDPHTITQGAISFFYNAGTIVTNETGNPNIKVLGWLDGNSTLPVTGILYHPTAKIFFIGDLNGIESLPQPFTNNIINWLF